MRKVEVPLHLIQLRGHAVISWGYFLIGMLMGLAWGYILVLRFVGIRVTFVIEDRQANSEELP